MSNKNASRITISLLRANIASCVLVLTTMQANAVTTIDLADQPLFSTVSVPGNLLLSLSVEWPTASTPAYLSTTAYSTSTTYVGYFDSEKCYRYIYNSTTPSSSYFTPNGYANSYVASTGTSNHTCTTTSTLPLWSGNYLNWATTQTLDAFRWALTGGPRAVDTTTATILEKTNHAGQGTHNSIYPDKALSSTSATGATPFAFAVTTRIWGGGTAMWITNTTNATSGNGFGSGTATPPATDYNAQYYLSSSSASTNASTTIYKLYMRVKVCDSSVGIESNCTQYGSNYKPEGLMQKYAMQLRYSAFGYLNDSTAARDGGVMRARMKYIGPNRPVPGSSNITNSAPEWDASTGIMGTNPDSSDASATTSLASSQGGYSVTISNSGVMNYLNKFGKVVTGNYKSYDPVSELYYAGTRYFKNLGNVSTYSNLAGSGSASNLTTWLDGFPVIQTWDDPIAYTCQKNFILGIGDVNTWNDANLPGSTIRSSSEPTIPSEVSSDNSISLPALTGDTYTGVTKATNMVGTLEGLNTSTSRLGTTYVSSSRNDTYFIAGLAYDVHTNDIRSDLSGTQSINTYWLDVMEGQTYVSKNEYWLATKYGGFDVPSGFSPYASSNGTSTLTDSMWHTTSDLTGSDKRPDNYFLANQADKMVSGLTKAFAKISSEAASASSTAFSSISPQLTNTGSASYSATYDPKTWSGVVAGSSIAFDSSGNPTLTQVWNARSILDATATSSRKIVTCCTTAGAGMPFQVTNLAATSFSRTYYTSFANIAGVSSSSQSAANYVAYLRGDRTKELANGGAYRTRTYLLGDIVGSKANAVGPPDFPLFDLTNPGYSSFKRTYASRSTVVYVGANDGMMHAFDGSITSSTGGSELFAYIPSFVYGDSTTAATSGLASLGNPSFTHHYLVDATPSNFDVDFFKTDTPTATTNDWHTLLIGGLGKGGKGYYAIDVTDPTVLTNETTIATKVLWEFTHTHMGYTYGDASVVKTKKWGWVVIFTSGYNNDDGKGYFFIVNPRNGALLETLVTPAGSTSSPINLAQHSTFAPDFTDGTADAIYAGDLQGNVWRVDLTPASGSYAAPTLIATLTDSTGAAQPVTTRPLIEIDPTSKKRYVMIGTGRLLADSDISSTQLQAFYAIIDGTNTSGGFYTTASLPTGVSFPVTRANLNANTNMLNGIGSSPANPMGWYFDLSAASSTPAIAERINVAPTANVGVVAFAANLPNGVACSPSGTSRSFALSFNDGKSVLRDSSGNAIAYVTGSSVVTDIAFRNVGGTVKLYDGDSSGNITNLPGNFNSSGSVKRLNWREVPTAD